MAPPPRVWTNNEEQIILCMMCKGLHDQLDDLDLATSFNQALNGGKPDTKDVEPKVVREKSNSLLRERPAFAKLLRFSRTTRVTSTLRKAFNRAIPFDGDKKEVEEEESTGKDSKSEAMKTIKDLVVRVEDTSHLPTTARFPFAMDQNALLAHLGENPATNANSGWGTEDISGTGTAQNQGGANVTDFAGAWGVENTSGFGVAQDGIGTNVGDSSGGWGTAEDTGFGVGGNSSGGWSTAEDTGVGIRTNLNDQDHRAGATASNAHTSNAVNVSRGWGTNDTDAGNFMDWTGGDADKPSGSQKKGKAKATAADDTATNNFEGWGMQDMGNTTTGQNFEDEWGNTTMGETWVTEQGNTDAALPKGSDAQADVAESSNANDLAYSGLQDWGGTEVRDSTRRGISLTSPLFVPETEKLDEAPGWNSVRSPNKSPAEYRTHRIVPTGDPDDPAGTWGSNDYEKLARPVAGHEDARKVDWSGLYDEKEEGAPSKDWERGIRGRSGSRDIQAADDIMPGEPTFVAGKDLWTNSTAVPSTRQTKDDDTPASLPPRLHTTSSPMINPARLALLADLSSSSPEPSNTSPNPVPRKIAFTGGNAAPLQPRKQRSAANSFGAKSAFMLETTGAVVQESQGTTSPVTPTWRVPGVDGYTPWAPQGLGSSSPLDQEEGAGGDIEDRWGGVAVKKKNNDSNDSKKTSRDGGGGS